MTVLFWVVTGFLGMQLLTLLTNLFTFPVLTPSPDRKISPDRRNGERVSILVPARDEAHNLPDTLPRLLRQREATEIIVLDDDSSDGTRELLERFAATDIRLRVLPGRPLPAGWNGKNWACHQLAGAATGSVLIFTDADVLWESRTLSALLELRAYHDSEFLSVWPRQITRTLSERITVPLIDLVLLGSLPYPGVRYLPHAAFSAGNGQLMLWTREGYERVGGHAAVRGEVLEDVRMGQRAKGSGLRVVLALGGQVLATRMYRSEREILEGFGKNILAAHNDSRALLVFSTVLNGFAYTLVWPLALFDPRWLLPALLGLVQRALTCAKTRRSPLEAPLQPLMAYSLLRISARALRATGYRWKGRVYR